MKQVKKVFNVEYDLTSEEFKAQKQDEISQKCQDIHPDTICKITTFTVPDKQIIVHTTQENVDYMGAVDTALAHRPLEEQSFLTMDDDMVKTYEITITSSSDLPDYETALAIAQKRADDMFNNDDSKLPLVTVIDYKWGNVPTTLTATIFSSTDAEGNNISLIGDTKDNVVVGDSNLAVEYEMAILYDGAVSSYGKSYGLLQSQTHLGGGIYYGSPRFNFNKLEDATELSVKVVYKDVELIFSSSIDDTKVLSSFPTFYTDKIVMNGEIIYNNPNHIYVTPGTNVLDGDVNIFAEKMIETGYFYDSYANVTFNLIDDNGVELTSEESFKKLKIEMIGLEFA